VELRSKYSQIRNEFEIQLKKEIPGIFIHGKDEKRLVNTSCISFPGLAADMLLLGFDMAGIQASAGSACAAGAVKSSRVIRNLGFPDDYASATIRFSFGMGNELADLEKIISKIKALVEMGGGLKPTL
jgi:cysteine desulfurase